MIEPKMNYNRYMASLEKTPLPSDCSTPLQVDYRGLVQYSHQKGIQPCDLSEEEKNKFIINNEKTAIR